MDISLARGLLAAKFRSAAELQSMLPALKGGCTAAEYDLYLRAIAAVIAEMSLQITNRLRAEHPELDLEVQAAVDRDGKYP
jgi:hypothetical protein